MISKIVSDETESIHSISSGEGSETNTDPSSEGSIGCTNSSGKGGSNNNNSDNDDGSEAEDLLHIALRRIRYWCRGASAPLLREPLVYMSVSNGDAICSRFEDITGMYIVLSSGASAINENDGEILSVGSLVGVEGLVYDALTSPATVRSCRESSCHLAFLPRESFLHPSWKDFRRMYILAHTPMIRHLFTDDIQFTFFNAECGDVVKLEGRICVVVSGVVSTSSTLSEYIQYYPGNLVGGYERITGKECNFTVESMCSYATMNDRSTLSMIGNKSFKIEVEDKMNHRLMVFEDRPRSRSSYGVYICESNVSVGVVPVVRRANVTWEDGIMSSVNEYTLSRIIGKGSTAHVFECYCPLRGMVAMKVFDNSTAQESLHREIMALQALRDHLNIVSLYTIIDDPTQDITCLVEELAERGSLLGVMMSTAMECRRVSYDIVRGLMYVHSMGFIHCDVKPSNIVRCADGISKLTDFGCCIRVGERDTNMIFMGTPAFMAPEMFTYGPLTTAVDVWSLACTMYQVVYGMLPFSKRYKANGNGQEDDNIEESIMYCEPYFGSNARTKHMRNIEENWESDDVSKFNHFCKTGLHKNPALRCTIGYWRQHDWLKHAS
jgi:Protein kinase domain